MDSRCWGWGPVADSYEHGKETSGSRKGAEFLDQLCDYYLLERNVLHRDSYLWVEKQPLWLLIFKRNRSWTYKYMVQLFWTAMTSQLCLEIRNCLHCQCNFSLHTLFSCVRNMILLYYSCYISCYHILYTHHLLLLKTVIHLTAPFYGTLIVNLFHDCSFIKFISVI